MTSWVGLVFGLTNLTSHHGHAVHRGVKLTLFYGAFMLKIENSGSLLLRTYSMCFRLPEHAELMQEVRVSHHVWEGGSVGLLSS